MQRFSIYLLLFLILPSLLGCDEATEISNKTVIKRKQAHLRALDNQCEADDECIITGCHQSICRASVDIGYCDHQIVFARLDVPQSALSNARDPSQTEALKQALEALIRPQLSPSQQKTLRVSADTRRAVITFHSDPARREAINRIFDKLDDPSGFYVPLVKNKDFLGELLPSSKGAHLRAAEGGYILLEMPVEDGDLQAAKQHLTGLLQDRSSKGERFAFELLPYTSPPTLRAWPIERRPRLFFQSFMASHVRLDPRQPTLAFLEGQLDASGGDLLSRLSLDRQGQVLLLISGDEVLAAPLLRAPIPEGRFRLSIEYPLGVSGDDRLKDVQGRLERLQASPTIAAQIQLDHAATQDAEAFLGCYQAEPPLARCGCEERRCQWLDSEALSACFSDPPE